MQQSHVFKDLFTASFDGQNLHCKLYLVFLDSLVFQESSCVLLLPGRVIQPLQDIQLSKDVRDRSLTTLLLASLGGVWEPALGALGGSGWLNSCQGNKNICPLSTGAV